LIYTSLLLLGLSDNLFNGLRITADSFHYSREAISQLLPLFLGAGGSKQPQIQCVNAEVLNE
jgi:hypothetical protein